MLGFWGFGFQNDHNIACPKNDLTTVFVAQITDPRIKNGVKVFGFEGGDNARSPWSSDSKWHRC